MKDIYPYAVFVFKPMHDRMSPGWGEAIWTGNANGHDDALFMADIRVPDVNFAPARVLTVCLCNDGPPTTREHKVSRTIESVG
jgi:hypothetical protein